MIRELDRADTIEALRVLRQRPVHNVFLEHIVRSGGLGALPGFTGYFSGGSLQGILLIGPKGGTALAGLDAGPCVALGESASRAPVRPRHIVGFEDFTLPFWSGYAQAASPLIWERREPVYCLSADRLNAEIAAVSLAPAAEHDLDEVVANSAQQYREDLKDDRFADDPDLFRARHSEDLRHQRWWIFREDGRIVFQVHRGPENDQVVQIGGVFTVPERRNRGIAASGVASLSRQLFATRPLVSLFCDEANGVARRVYERIGFGISFYYRSWLLDTRAEGSVAP